MTTLRDDLLRLAHDNPDGIRRHLVPMLRTAGVPLVRLRDMFMPPDAPGGGVDVQDLHKAGVHLPLSSGHLAQTEPTDSARKAEAMAQRIVKDYKRSHHPGGMGVVVAVVEYVEELEPQWRFVGVANLYYSGS